MKNTPELWGHRPFQRGVLNHAVKHMGHLSAASPVLWERLSYTFGPNIFHTVQTTSQNRANIAASAGFACRQQFKTMYDDQTKNQPHPHAAAMGFPDSAQVEDDGEMDDWLAKRFGKKGGASASGDKGTPASAQSATVGERGAPAIPGIGRRALSQDRLPLLASAMRDGDSPRTAAWRAVVAQMSAPHGGRAAASSQLGSRQRSSSPTLENWLARRTVEKGKEPGESRRASSLPPPPRESVLEPAFGQFDGLPRTMPVYSHIDVEVDHRPWVEIVEEEHEKEAKECEDDLFEELKQEDLRRLNEAEISSKTR